MQKIFVYPILCLLQAISFTKSPISWAIAWEKIFVTKYPVCLIWLFMSQSTIFQLCRDGSSWVEPVLSKD